MDIEIGDVILVDTSLIFGGDQNVFVEKVIEVEEDTITSISSNNITWTYNKNDIIGVYKVKDIHMDVNIYMKIVMKLQGIEYNPFKIE